MEVARHAAVATVAALLAVAEATVAGAVQVAAVHAAVEVAGDAGGAARASAYRLEVWAFVGEEKGGRSRPSLSAKRGALSRLGAIFAVN
jgi:hypothetical protein